MGILGGDSDLKTLLPELIGYHLKGQFPIEKLIEYFDFDQINEAIAASENGSVVKPVLRIGREN
jgi:aryl-alcohol dehydrogenase